MLPSRSSPFNIIHYHGTAGLLGNNSVDDNTGTGICRLVVLLVVASKLPAAKHFAITASICITRYLQLIT